MDERKAVQSAMQLAKTLIILTCCTAFSTLATNAVPVISRTEVVGYLSRFGYLPAIDQESEAPTSEEAFSRAISKFQSFMGINITGEIDVETTNLMTKPRCGVPDIVRPELGKRSKRYAFLGTKWGHRSLTYKVTKYSRKLGAATVDREIARAFAVWSNYADLTFTRKSGQVDIEISFVRRWHGDGMPFDGPGFPGQQNTLGHTFPPGPGIGGDVHFDDDEPWTVHSNYGIDFFQVAVHEFGHALGLDHSNVNSAIMYATYRDELRNLMLDSDDIAGIQALYGAKTGNNPRNDYPRDERPQLCAVTKIDTIFITPDNRVYVFKGKYYWRLIKSGIAAGYPKLIADTWIGLPSNIDTAFAYNGWTYFFKDSKYWAYSGGHVVTGNSIEVIPNSSAIPSNIDAIVGPYANGDIHFFKGRTFWKHNHARNSDLMSTDLIPISNWPGLRVNLGYFFNDRQLWGRRGSGLPDNLDAAFTYNGYTFFFKDDVYYRYNERTFLMDAGGPRKTASDWFGCR